ncbi:MAG: D-tyrosyl-tRNA(Tyr) deacylase [Methanoregulaceae archaeon]|jgi:D-aminoacyl-tRNA deacylase|nr:D-tyrosyl-tRNA(Tyr) deacylase [Methanoregulaceae archaeon]MCU0628883.1 D-tyrosyl-tRNA(Tyr) deacylase [Methanoregulaceae archaeon]
MEDLLANPESSRPFPLEHHKLVFHEVSARLIFQDHIDDELDADLIIFLSRHSSENPFPVLTVHVTGNIGPARLGGITGSLAVASPPWMHAVLCNLNKNAPEGYRVTYEITHHGPTELSTPSFFVEIGSTGKEWTDARAGHTVALSVFEADPADTVNVLGIGGTHYARRETEIAIRSRTAFGHIVHSRFVSSLDTMMLSALAEKSSANAVYIDKKAITPGEMEMIETVLMGLGIPRLSEHELLQLRSISWSTWEEIRRSAQELHSGSDISISAGMKDGSPHVLWLPDDLVAETIRVNLCGLREGIGKLPVASLSSRGNPLLPVFITTEENPALVLNDLISLCVTLICSGETTAVEGDRLIISRTRFDPEKARHLGIPRGPLFGELMKGGVVNVNGREITPDMVRTRTVTCIRIPGLEKLI